MSEAILMDQPERAFYFYTINVSNKSYYNTNNAISSQRSLKAVPLELSDILRFRKKRQLIALISIFIYRLYNMYTVAVITMTQY